MYIIRKLLGQLGQYKLAAILAPIFTLAAVGLEVLIPYVMALLIDRGISVGDMGQVFQWGAIMLLCALLALLVGASSGVFGSEAATALPPTCATRSSRRCRPTPLATSTSSQPRASSRA